MQHVRTMTGLALSLVLTACVSTATQVSTSYYDVRGTTAEDIDRDIRAKGPLKGHALALAAIQFEPVSILQRETDKGCHFEAAKFRVKAAITLPRWTDRLKSPDRDLRRAWQGLSDYARWHEDMHVRIAERFASQLSRDIEAIEPQKTCDRLDRTAKTIVDRNARSHDKAQNAFDRAEQKRLQQLIAANGG